MKRAGAKVLRGGLDDLDVLREGAAQADYVVSLAFKPNYDSAEGLAAAVAEESAALALLGDTLFGSERPIVAVSGTPWVTDRASTEADPCRSKVRSPAECDRSTRSWRSLPAGCEPPPCACPRTVHNKGQGGFAGLLVDQARRSGVAGYARNGRQWWPAVHAQDAASLF